MCTTVFRKRVLINYDKGKFNNHPQRNTVLFVREIFPASRQIPFGAFHSPSPPLSLNVLNVNLIFTRYMADSFVAAVTYNSYSLLRFHVSRGLSVSGYIFRRRGTAVTGDSISFTNGPVTRGNFCNILNRLSGGALHLHLVLLHLRVIFRLLLLLSFYSFFTLPCTGIGLHCPWTFSRRLARAICIVSRGSRYELREGGRARNIRRRINVMRDFVNHGNWPLRSPISSGRRQAEAADVGLARRRVSATWRGIRDRSRGHAIGENAPREKSRIPRKRERALSA